jgi:hypothetical protein
MVQLFHVADVTHAANDDAMRAGYAYERMSVQLTRAYVHLSYGPIPRGDGDDAIQLEFGEGMLPQLESDDGQSLLEYDSDSTLPPLEYTDDMYVAAIDEDQADDDSIWH